MSTSKDSVAARPVTSHIDGVGVKELAVHADDRGYLIEVVRDDDPVFRQVKQTRIAPDDPRIGFDWRTTNR